ncbi:MAG: hypothetical protein IJZ53_03335 [Tyzzerella sp.]|nr:hypothetical protein [Tyzzerella sp.]
MKLNKKKVFVSALAISLIAILSMGSLAWFSDSDKVVNEFYVADSEDDTPEEIFSVDVWEYTENSPTEKVPAGDTYTDILPGDVLKKEPHVANTGHYEQYIRVIVEISDATAWINAVGIDYDMTNVFVGFEEAKWNNISKDIEGSTDTITYVLYYNEKLASGNDITLFTDVKIPESLTKEQAAAFEGGFSINVKAQAVQTENVGENAYAAFQKVGMAITE